MSYRPSLKKKDEETEQITVTDLPLDAETLQGYKPCVNIVTLEDNGSTTAGTWLAKTNKVSALVDGQLFLYKITVAGASTTTLNITGSAGTALGAKTVYRVGTTKLTTQYPINHYILLAYNSLNTCFRVVNDYDANSYAYVRQYQHGKNAAGATNLYPILTRYNLTNKSGTYDNAYARFHTDTYIDVTNGYLYAPKVYSGGSEVAVKTDIPTETTVSGWGFTKFAGYTSSNKLNHSYIDYKWTRVLTPTIINPDSNQYVKITDISVSGTYRISSNSINHSVVVKIKYNGSENSDYFSIMTDSPIDDLMASDTPRDIALLNVYIRSYGSYNQWEWTLTSSAGFFIGETGPSGGWFRKIDGTVTSVDSVSPSSGNVSLSAVRYVSQSLTDAQKTQARSNIGAGTSSLTIGTTASTAAAGNHTHGTTLATDSGTATVTMEPDTTYKLSTGGTNVIFKTPSDAYKIAETLRKGSEADTAVGYYKIATINHYSWNFCDFCMLLKNSYAGTTYSTVFNCSCSDSNVDLRNFKLEIISGTDISDKLAYLYTYDSGNNLIKIEVFIHATRFEHPTCYIINARLGQQLVIPTQDEFNKATPDKPDGTTMTGYATYAIVSVGTNGQLLSSNGSSLVWTNDNRGLLHHDLGVTIENTTTDKGWKMFNSTYNGFLLKSVRFNASSPLWGIGDYGSGIVFGGDDTKGVISLSWRLAQIKFAGGNSGNGGPVWWIGLNGTSTTTYDLDKLRAKPDRVTGSKAYSQANLTSLYDLIEAHKDIKFWTYKYTPGAQRTEMYSLMYNASYSGVLGKYSVNFYYINGGTVTELSSGTVYYEYLK